MRDIALDLLIEASATLRGNVLWVIDEQTDVASVIPSLKRLKAHAISQRVDQVKLLASNGIKATLNDYQLDDSVGYDAILMRLSKQKALQNHVLNQVPRCLNTDGCLLISGAKNEGIKSFVKPLSAVATNVWKNRGKQQNEVYGFDGLNEATLTLADDEYSTPRPCLDYNGIPLHSKPGIFGWKKIDVGTRLLVEALPQTLFDDKPTVLDLGCGYGLLSVFSANAGATVTATDNNVAAVSLTALNLAQYGQAHQAIGDDCASSIREHFDLVLCNPPFHSGFNMDSSLTERFVETAAKRLKANGRAYFVVNQFLALEPIAQRHFAKTQKLANKDGFDVFVLGH